ncbi:MAG TPA: hypothetical protein VFO39_09005 [Candidatus Sulfotelmatobacter sp.]|nr:hypothetical protein [Candidatus Sulfotelmatobacter sp.]
MAAKPIPRVEDATEVTINPDNTVVGQVEVNNGGMVKFEVSSYPYNQQGQQYNECYVTITSANISWGISPDAGPSTIKVGN